jgi:hypothetical protein
MYLAIHVQTVRMNMMLIQLSVLSIQMVLDTCLIMHFIITGRPCILIHLDVVYCNPLHSTLFDNVDFF